LGQDGDMLPRGSRLRAPALGPPMRATLAPHVLALSWEIELLTCL